VVRQPETAEYERVLKFDLSSPWCATWPARPTRTRVCQPSGWQSAALPATWTKTPQEAGLMPDGAVIIAAITSCTNTSNPRNVIRAACWRATPTSWG
jgi:aconitase A